MKRIFTLLFLAVAFLSFSQDIKNITFTQHHNPDDVTIKNPVTALSSGREKIAFKPSMFKQALHPSVRQFKVIARDASGNPIAIEGISKHASNNRNLTTEKKAEAYLKEIAPLMGFAEIGSDFVMARVTTDENGNQHIRLTQQWNGIPVYGSEIMLHSERGDINFMNGRYAQRPNALASVPLLDESAALGICKADLGSLMDEFTLGNTTIKGKTSTLVYLQKENNHYTLAYHHTVYKNPVERWEYFIDATNGTIIKKYPSICKFHNHQPGHLCFHNETQDAIKTTASSYDYTEQTTLGDGATTANAVDLFNITRQINTYQVGSRFYLIDGSRPMFNLSQSAMPDDPVGSIWTIDAFNTSPQNNNFSYDHVSSTNNSWNSKIAVSAHFNGGKAYEYFKNLHSRNSINGSGGNIISLINISDENGSSMGNAFWNGQAMFYGNGDAAFKELARGLDVAGHEMTHGVVQNTANLDYQGESGALNESFADVFGVMIDRDDWLVGEDVVKTSAFPSGALRSLSDPHNGASTGNFNAGWQPKKYSERYTGQEDNGGVHINSGIPNHAFFLFASNANVGKDKAEKVYYKALSDYLTKSSQFIDARIAIVRAANELFGAAAATAAGQAFDAVEVFSGQGGEYEEDINTNPGQEMILFTTDSKQGLYIFTPAGQEIANPLSQKSPASRPSISDDGSLIVFVGSDRKLNYIQINWQTGAVNEGIFDTGNSLWRSVAVSKDGSRISALSSDETNTMFVFDLFTGNGRQFILKNPTFSSGISTGDVLYADIMDWDYSGEYVMYDAKNRIKGVSGDIEYWDIGFIKVWNNNSDNFESTEQIEKLFPSLDEGITIGNPSFSKNSPYIIAFDYIESGLFDDSYAVLGANLEAGELGAIVSDNTGLGYPTYSRQDNFLVYNRDDAFGASTALHITGIDGTKISTNGNDGEYGDNLYWGVWFSNGKRDLTALNEINDEAKQDLVTPNPASDKIRINSGSGKVLCQIINLTGQMVQSVQLQHGDSNEIDVSGLQAGTYIIQCKKDGELTQWSKFIKL